jgi:ArsR family transcriptional regulator, arsenate/arsenite/antimonite-responsive transcriptional repressor
VRKPLPLVECATPLAGSSLSDEEAAELERLLQTIGDRTRLRILNILIRARGTPVCVCEFVPELGLTQPTISYHLKQLRQAGLLERERRGAFSYYQLVPGVLERAGGIGEARDTRPELV